MGNVVIRYDIIAKPEFSEDVLKKAQMLKEIFAGKDLQFYCDAVKTTGNLPIEDLIENFAK